MVDRRSTCLNDKTSRISVIKYAKPYRRPSGSVKHMAASMEVGDFKKTYDKYEANALALALKRMQHKVSVIKCNKHDKYGTSYYVIRNNEL